MENKLFCSIKNFIRRGRSGVYDDSITSPATNLPDSAGGCFIVIVVTKTIMIEDVL